MKRFPRRVNLKTSSIKFLINNNKIVSLTVCQGLRDLYSWCSLFKKERLFFYQRWTCREPGLELETTIGESGSIAGDCPLMRCNWECIFSPARSSLHPEGRPCIILCICKERDRVCRNEICVGISECILIPAPQKWATVLHFCTVQIAIWIWICNLELFSTRDFWL